MCFRYYSIPFQRSYDLRYLLDLLDSSVPITHDMYEKAMKLNGFGVEIRYPEIKIELNENERDEAIQMAREFREFVKGNLDFEIDEKELPD